MDKLGYQAPLVSFSPSTLREQETYMAIVIDARAGVVAPGGLDVWAPGLGVEEGEVEGPAVDRVDREGLAGVPG